MADAEASEEQPVQITFTVRASNDLKYPVTLSENASVADLKQKLSASDLADIPAERQRLIFSGRVLKDTDTLSQVKIKEGHTIHLVRSAASNARQTPAASSPAAAAIPTASNVPTNIAAGTGNNPLAHLTGARYAGFHGLPNMAQFGADGGMGAPTTPEDMLRQLEDPNFVSQMNEVMNSPMFAQMMEQSPMFRDNPLARQMIRDPALRRMMLDPNVIRAQIQMQQQMGTNPFGGGASFPAPGAADTTTPQNPTSPPANTTPAGNPFAALAGAHGYGNPFGAMAGGQGGGANPFAALFQPPPAGTPNAQSPPTTNAAPPGTFRSQADRETVEAAANAANNPLLQGAMPPGLLNFIQATAREDLANRDGQTPNTAEVNAATQGYQNELMSGFLAHLAQQQASTTPPDTRPPEERYESQLRQLNDMGFFEFERNIEALRRSGGSVQGAIEYLLSGP